MARFPISALLLSASVFFAQQLDLAKANPLPTTTTLSPRANLPVPSAKPVQCNSKSNHQDVKRSDQAGWADKACNSDIMNGKTLQPGASGLSFAPEGQTFVWSYSVSWIDGCETQAAEQDVSRPLQNYGTWDPTCKDLFVTAYSDCNNGGSGGYIDAGCLRYSFTVTQ